MGQVLTTSFVLAVTVTGKHHLVWKLFMYGFSWEVKGKTDPGAYLAIGHTHTSDAWTLHNEVRGNIEVLERRCFGAWKHWEFHYTDHVTNDPGLPSHCIICHVIRVVEFSVILEFRCLNSVHDFSGLILHTFIGNTNNYSFQEKITHLFAKLSDSWQQLLLAYN